jgi:N-methylhydantoinase B
LSESLALAQPSGAPAPHRGGLGYDKRIRMLEDAYFMSIADRSILSCWGVKGGKAGAPFRVTIDPGGPNEREMEGLVDDELVRAGEVIRIRTTGGGGWGDPLDRDVDAVVRDVRWGKVSRGAAERDYGVVLVDPGEGAAGAPPAPAGTDEVAADPDATAALRARLRDERGENPAFFDRGPGYAQLDPDGAAYPEVDLL